MKNSASHYTTTDNRQHRPSLIPLSVTFGLGVLVFALSSAGFILRLMLEQDSMAVLWHAFKIISIFMLVIPSLMCVGAYIMNRLQHSHIAMRNAWTFGWLLSCVGLLTIIARYS